MSHHPSSPGDRRQREFFTAQREPRTSIQPTLDGGYSWRVVAHDGTILHEGGRASCSSAAFAAGDRAIERLKAAQR